MDPWGITSVAGMNDPNIGASITIERVKLAYIKDKKGARIPI